MSYCIREGYVERLDNRYFDDTPLKVEWQKEVYVKARQLADELGLTSVLDIGTGSGYKLLKYFSDKRTLGVDLEPTVEWLKRTYPEREWATAGELPKGYDLAICADVIEHIVDPDILLDQILASAPQTLVISTPIREVTHNGPPANPHHVREWTMPEFAFYIGKRFTLLDHFISNNQQRTQVIIARV